MYTSATPELALLEVLANLQEGDIPDISLLIFEVPDSQIQAVDTGKLPTNWKAFPPEVSINFFFRSWLNKPDCISQRVPSAIVDMSFNYLLHTESPDFHLVKVVANSTFNFDPRLLGR